MTDPDDLKSALREDPQPSRRAERAARTRARALSPRRVLASLISLPFLTAAVALSVYVRTSPYEPTPAVLHLVARFGCDAAGYVGLAPARRGGLGYHARNDGDGDGVACEAAVSVGSAPTRGIGLTAPAPTADARVRMVGGAKFVKP